jgi:DNA polymerase-3 subunit beta
MNTKTTLILSPAGVGAVLDALKGLIPSGIVRAKDGVIVYRCGLLSLSPAGAPLVRIVTDDDALEINLGDGAHLDGAPGGVEIAPLVAALRAAKPLCAASGQPFLVVLDHDSGAATCHTGDRQFAAHLGRCVPDGDFPRPVWVYAKTPDAVALPASLLRAVLAHAAPHISTEETRYYLNGVYLHRRAGADGPLPAFDLVATNGHTLGHARVTVSPLTDDASPADIILGAETVKWLLAALPDAGDDLVTLTTGPRLKVGGSLVEVSAPGWHLTARGIDGSFPDYARVMPAMPSDPATIGNAAQMTVAALAKAPRDGTQPVALIAAPAGGQAVVLSADTPKDARPDCTAAYNAQYLVAAFGGLRNVTAGLARRAVAAPVRFHNPGKGEPCRIEPAALLPGIEAACAVVMPMRA